MHYSANKRALYRKCVPCMFRLLGWGGIPSSIPTALFHGPGRLRRAAKFPRRSGTTHQQISLSRAGGGLGHEIPRALRGPPSEDLDRDRETERESTRTKVWIGSHFLAQALFNVAIDPVISGLFSSRVDDHGTLQEWNFLVRFKSIHRYLFDLGFSRMCLF